MERIPEEPPADGPEQDARLQEFLDVLTAEGLDSDHAELLFEKIDDPDQLCDARIAMLLTALREQYQGAAPTEDERTPPHSASSPETPPPEETP